MTASVRHLTEPGPHLHAVAEPGRQASPDPAPDLLEREPRADAAPDPGARLRALPEPGPDPQPLALPGPGRRPRLRALPEYEPSYAPGEVPPRWSSLRPATGPQLTLVTPPQEPTITEAALRRLLMRILEVLEGRRNVGQLHTLLSPPAYEALLTRLRITTPGRAHRLRRVRTCYPSATAAEITAVIDIAAAPGEAGRVRAMATRLERAGESWHCAVLRVL